MVEILVKAYLALGLPAALLIWAALAASKRDDTNSQNEKHKSV